MQNKSIQNAETIAILQAQVAARNAALKQENEKAAQVLAETQRRNDIAFAALSALLPKVVIALCNEGLGISEFTFGKNGNTETWEEGQMMVLHITAVPTNKKIQFVPDQGYLSSGRARNRETCSARSAKLTEALTAALPEMSVQVNSASFQARPVYGSNRLLIDMWMK